MGYLTPGTELRGLDGAAVTVVAVRARAVAVTVYNFEVAETHTYFVAAESGGAAVGVHNACGGSVSVDDITAANHADFLDGFVNSPIEGSYCQPCAVRAGLSVEFWGRNRAVLEIPSIPHVFLGVVDDTGQIIAIDNTKNLGGLFGNRIPLDQYMQNVANSGITGPNPTVQVWPDFWGAVRMMLGLGF